MTSFEFVFILHLMKELLGFTDDLSQALQRKSQDILNAMHLVSLTKNFFKNLEIMDENLFLRVLTHFVASRHRDP